jgi:hypothetical protein
MSASRSFQPLPLRFEGGILIGSLQSHNRANQAPIFLQLHLWMHLILASAFVTGQSLSRRSKPFTNGTGTKSGAATPNSATVSSVWRNSARTIGDILVLSDIINGHSYLALPFVNQAFYVAGCCYVKGKSPRRRTVDDRNRTTSFLGTDTCWFTQTNPHLAEHDTPFPR